MNLFFYKKDVCLELWAKHIANQYRIRATLLLLVTFAISTAYAQTGSVNYEHIFVLGQSRANGALTSALTYTQPYSNLYWDYSARVFRPLVEGQIPYYPGTETIGSSLANYLSGASGQKYVVDHDAKDGTCIYNLNRQNPVTKSGPYAGMFGEMADVKNSLAGSGYSSAITAVTWQQGECDAMNRSNASGDPNAPTSYYLNTLRQMVLDIRYDAANQTGQSRKPVLFLDQISSETAYSTPATLDAANYSVGMQQWQLADGADSDKAVLVGPTYQFAYKDGVHTWESSNRAEGFYFGKVMKRVLVDHQAWTPLKPRSIALSGNTISVQFWVPVPPLQWGIYNPSSNPYEPAEHTWSAVQNGQPLQVYRGFEFWDGTANPPVVTGATITGPDTLTLSLSSPSYGPTPRLRYAYSGLSGTWAGLTNSAGQPSVNNIGGNLKDSDATLDPLGNRMPNWCVRFDAALPFSSSPSLAPDLGGSVVPVPIPVPAADTTPPAVAILNPANGSTVSGTTGLTLSASDNSGSVAKVDVYLDSTLVTSLTASPYSYGLDTTQFANGVHTITARAYDPSGNIANATAAVTIANSVVVPPPIGGGGAWTQGFNFRRSAGFVADPANTMYVLCSDAYPTTRNGITFGWESGAPGCADESNSNDPRLAGYAYTILRQKAVFRIDLPAGSYTVGLAQGDFWFNQSPYLQLLDGASTPVLTLPQSAVSAGFVRDAKGTAWPAGSWANSQQTQTISVSSGVLRLSLDASQSNTTVTFLNHLMLQSLGSTPPPTIGSTSWTKGFNFRNSPGFAADSSDSTYVLCTDAYPTSRNGVTFGWEGNLPLCVDESRGADARLAGYAYTYGNKVATFRVDSPVATYSVRLGAGSGMGYQFPYLSFMDNQSVGNTLAPGLLLPGFYVDALGQAESTSGWLAGQQVKTMKISSGIFRVTLDPARSPKGTSLINNLQLISQ